MESETAGIVSPLWRSFWQIIFWVFRRHRLRFHISYGEVPTNGAKVYHNGNYRSVVGQDDITDWVNIGRGACEIGVFFKGQWFTAHLVIGSDERVIHLDLSDPMWQRYRK